MDIDRSLDDIAAEQKKAKVQARPARTTTAARGSPAGRGGGGGAAANSPRGGGAIQNSPYTRPPPRNPNQAWTHDMYNVPDHIVRQRIAAVPAGQMESSPKLIITNIHYEVTPAELKSIFERTGKIISGPNLRYDRSGRSMGIAHVEYALPKSAREAINLFDGNLAKGQALQIKYDDSHPPRRSAPINNNNNNGFFSNSNGGSTGGGGGGSLLNRIEGGKGLTGGGGGAESSPAAGMGRGSGGPIGGFRGGRALARGAGAGRGRGAPGSGSGSVRPAKQAPKTAEDLDKELEGYHGSTSTPAAAAPAVDGDVEMS